MRREITLTDVRLELGDPPDAAPVGVFADQAPAEERGADLEGRQGEQGVAIERSGQFGRTVT